MKIIFKVILALFAAALVPAILPAIIFLAVTGSLISIFIPLAITFAHMVILGVPALLLGWYLHKIRWWSSLLVAFIIGATPTAILFWPLHYPALQTTASHWDGNKMVATIIDGVPTTAGWLQFISISVIAGLFGISGGVAFWLVWQYENYPDLQDES
jgi:hypothetical protein